MSGRRNYKQSGGSVGSVFVGIIIIVIVLIVLYYLYQWLFTSTMPTSFKILNGTPAMTLNSGSAATTASPSAPPASYVAATDLSGVNDQGQFSVTFWVYVARTSAFGSTATTQLAHLLEISNNRFAGSNAGNTLLYVGLNPLDATLVVRQGTVRSPIVPNNSVCGANGLSDSCYSVNDITTGYNNSGNTLGNGQTVPMYQGGGPGGNRCDIVNGIEYQRWVLIGLVGNARVLDIYVDGKLARSCVYDSGNGFASANGTATAYFGLGNAGKLVGYFSDGNFYNYALTPAGVWAVYQNGPGGPFNVWDYIQSFFGTNITVTSLNKGGQTGGLGGPPGPPGPPGPSPSPSHN